MAERLTDCEIQFGMFDVTAKDDGAVTISDKQPWSKPETQLKLEEQILPNYGTLELNQFVLDGEHRAMPDDPENHFFGWWSAALSNQGGAFTDPPVLTVQFSENHSSLGITFRFDEPNGDFCSSLNIKWYDDTGVLLADQDFTPDSAYYFADYQVNDYQRVVVTFYKTARPYRYLKLTEIMYGALRVFGGPGLISAKVLEEVDPISTQLSINTLHFKFHSDDGEFAILDLKGVWSLLQWRQWFRVWAWIGDQKIRLGAYYLDEPEADSENTTSMSCIDLLGVIDATEYKGGIYVDVTADALVAAIMESAGEPTGYEMDPDLAGIVISGWLPICTHREALQQVAFAIGAIVDCSRSEKIRLYPMPEVIAGTIGHDRKIDGHTLKMEPMTTGVEITSHSYVAETASDKEQDLQNGVLETGEHEIKFGTPMHSLVIEGAAIKESGPNYAKLQVDTAGTVVLRGKPYTDNTSICGYYAPELPAQQKPNVLQIEDATLVIPGLAPEVAWRVYEYYQLRYEDEGDLILSAEAVGQLIRMDSMNGRQLEGIVESLDIDLTGGFLAAAKIKGRAV